MTDVKRLYFFEAFTLANLILAALLLHRSLPLAAPLFNVLAFASGLAMQALAGIAVRCAIAAARRDHAYLRIIRRRAWIADTLRLIAAGSFAVFTYGWIKLVVPLYHPTLFDQTLWDLDRALFFGLSPNVFFLDLFNGALRAFDWSYAMIFYVSTIVAFAYFLSHPSRRIRAAFANGNCVLWIAGAWLYFLVPSVGPAFRFPDLWLVHEQALARTQELQALLMRNYQNVLRAGAGEPVTRRIQLVFGIGAFPSLHVAFQMYVFLWMRRLFTAGEVLFGLFVAIIFLGSMITGWHYLIDGLCGVALALACYKIPWRAARMPRFLELFSSAWH